MITKYPSVAAMVADFVAHTSGDCRGIRGAGPTWFGGETREDSIRLAQQGNTNLVPEAEALLSELDVAIETPRRVWDRSPAGAYASVPDVLAGLPTPMRRQVYVADDRAPITILSCLTISAGVSTSIIRRRGITILALAMALSRIRPISLNVLTVTDGLRDNTGENVIMAEINTKPLDLATACHALTSAGFVRRITYCIADLKNGFGGGWPKDYAYGRPDRDGGTYFDRLIPRLGLDPAYTLIIPAAEYNDPMLNDAVGWIKAQITRFAPEHEDAFA
jgi:hypothetical protein